MSNFNIDFDDKIQWLTKENYFSNRPYVELNICYRGKVFIPVWSLIDTGADYLILPHSVASDPNIVLRPTNKNSTILLANGSTVSLPKKKLIVSFKNRAIVTTAIIGTASCPMGTTPLIGRIALLKLFDYGMEKDGWLYKQ